MSIVEQALAAGLVILVIVVFILFLAIRILIDDIRDMEED